MPDPTRERTGEKFGKDSDAATAAALAAIRDEARADKVAKKATFDAEHDAGACSSCTRGPSFALPYLLYTREMCFILQQASDLHVGIDQDFSQIEVNMCQEPCLYRRMYSRVDKPKEMS